jgi:hypothetical protein
LAKDKHKELAKLGAETLATALLDLADYNDAAEAVVERLLASPKENAKTFSKRLSSIRRRHHLISWGETGAFARELKDLLKALEASAPEPKDGVLSVAAFYEADAEIFEQCDDSNGSVGGVFKFDAADLFSSFASRCDDKDWLLEQVIKLNKSNGYGVRDVLFEKMSLFLPEDHLRKAVNRLWEEDNAEKTDRYGSRWLTAIEQLAWQLKDPLLLEKVKRSQSNGELPTAFLIDIAKLHFECGDLNAALEWLTRFPADKSFRVHERDELLIAIYQGLKKPRKVAETSLKVFKRDRDIESLNQLVRAVGEEKRAEIVDESVKTILKAREFSTSDAEFLIETNRIDDAENYILAHATRLNGDLYAGLLDLAKSVLKHDRLVAAYVIYRALLDSILARANSKYYHHGVSYLKKLDSLAKKISDWKEIEPHSKYLEYLRQKHKHKSSFWSQYAPQK